MNIQRFLYLCIFVKLKTKKVDPLSTKKKRKEVTFIHTNTYEKSLKLRRKDINIYYQSWDDLGDAELEPPAPANMERFDGTDMPRDIPSPALRRW